RVSHSLWLRGVYGTLGDSNYAHDRPEIAGLALPDPEELLADVLAFDSFIKEVNARSVVTEGARKKGPSAAAALA
ncbi:hypothetical protein, partial [Stenotrophomonas sp.]|uniref:hypothetical protein n=1 Tax=Stenotrophomonas sp. TaxID=69392 RepID=UPI002FC6CC4C